MTNRIPPKVLLSRLLDTSKDAIVFADEKGVILQANSCAHRTFGYDDGTLEGISVNALMPDEHSVLHDGYMSRYKKTGKKRIIGIGRDLEGVRKDGSRFPLHLSIGHGTSQDGDFYVGVMHDLTVRRQVEQALERSQRMEALGELTGGVAHDFNNLLTIITGNLELLLMGETEEPEAGMLQDALEAAELGIELTSRLLVFARRGVLTPEDVNVNRITLEMAALLRRTIGADISLITKLEEHPWNVHVDVAQLQTGIVNLAINAKAAMPNGGTLIIETANMVIDDGYIAQELDVRRGEYVRVSVSDNGVGMSETVRRRALEPFFTTKPTGQGTGLGLAMLYGFARQSGGHVSIYSEEGQGTTVSIYLPKVQQSDTTEETADPPISAQMPRGDGQIVLVVEDDPAVRRVSVKRIEALGYRTMRADSADKALEVLTTTPEVAVVFSDIVMPGSMTGYELAKVIRLSYPKVRVMLTTAYAGKLIDATGERLSGFLLLRKPFRQEDLAHKLHDLLNG